MLWIFSALCKAVWLTWNALSNTGMYTGIKSHSRTDLTPNTGALGGGSCCSGGRCSCPAMPRAPPPPPPRCRLGWRGSPPRSGQSASTRRCVAQPAAGQTSKNEFRHCHLQDWFSPWPKTEVPPLRRAPTAISRAGAQWSTTARASPTHWGLAAGNCGQVHMAHLTVSYSMSL